MIHVDDMRPYLEQSRKEREEFEKKCLELRRKELEAKGLKLIDKENLPKRDFHGDGDHPHAMENGPALVLYIIIMVGGAIFNDRWLIWVFATMIFLKFITRHKK